MESPGERVVKIRVRDFSDLVRLAASGMTMGQPTYIVRFASRDDTCIYGIMAVFKDFYRYYGIPLIYYWLDEGCRMPLDRNYAIVRSDETGEHVELSKGFKAGAINVPIINLQEIPDFMWEG